MVDRAKVGNVVNLGTGLLDEFKAFVFRGNVVDLAVAFVIATAFKEVVDSMVADIIMPIIGIVGGAPNFSGNTFSINGSEFGWGNFVTKLLAFVIVAAVVYFLVVKPMNLVLTRLKISKETEDGTETVTQTTVKDTQ